MRLSGFGYAFAACATALFLTSCGGIQVPLGAPAVIPHLERASTAMTYKVLFNFGQSFDGYRGIRPTAGLVEVNQNLYGTTLLGGQNYSGTLFSITKHGAQRVIYSFGAVADGVNPIGTLVPVNGELYGTASSGGNKFGDGTVFGIETTGQNLHLLHTFAGGSDGDDPMAGLVAADGWLYGTTYKGGIGGSMGYGTVFAVRLSDGKTKTLHRFIGGSDGRYPAAPVVYSDGALYGTTSAGGPEDDGTVFSINIATSKEKILYGFSGVDGSTPQAGLIVQNGNLYGTTTGGGTGDNGTVFRLTIANSNEKVLHEFKGYDGSAPEAGLTIGPNSILYGTTIAGGITGYGTVFSVGVNGGETVLHNFDDGYKADGLFPDAPLLYSNGKLYGTTYAGGRHHHPCSGSSTCDYGTVFELSP